MISDAGRGETGGAKHAQDGREARPEPGRSTVMEEEAPVESERKRRLSWRRGGGGEREGGEVNMTKDTCIILIVARNTT